MAIRNYDDDYRWVLPRKARALGEQENSALPKLSDTLIELATVAACFAGIILLIEAVVTALN